MTILWYDTLLKVFSSVDSSFVDMEIGTGAEEGKIKQKHDRFQHLSRGVTPQLVPHVFYFSGKFSTLKKHGPRFCMILLHIHL